MYFTRIGTVRLLLALMLYLLLSVTALPSPTDERQIKCAETKEKIRKIESKMRQGYTARQGIKMQDELRSLREQRKRLCHCDCSGLVAEVLFQAIPAIPVILLQRRR